MVVVYPVSCARNLDHAIVAKGLQPAIPFRVGGPTFEAPKQQDGTDDLPQHLLQVGQVMAKRRKDASVVIELPDE